MAVCFSMFGFYFLLLSCRFSLLARLVLAAYYLLQPARSYLLATHRPTVASVFSPRVVRWSLHVLAACELLFASHKVNLLPHWCSSLAAVYYSHHSTLIASHTLFLVVCRSLFEICCFLPADRFALLSSCFSLLFETRWVLVSRILLLADCSFLFFVFLIKGPKLFTLMTPNITTNFTSNGVSKFMGAKLLSNIKIFVIFEPYLNYTQLIDALFSISLLATY